MLQQVTIFHAQPIIPDIEIIVIVRQAQKISRQIGDAAGRFIGWQHIVSGTEMKIALSYVGERITEHFCAAFQFFICNDTQTTITDFALFRDLKSKDELRQRKSFIKGIMVCDIRVALLAEQAVPFCTAPTDLDGEAPLWKQTA